MLEPQQWIMNYQTKFDMQASYKLDATSQLCQSFLNDTFILSIYIFWISNEILDFFSNKLDEVLSCK